MKKFLKFCFFSGLLIFLLVSVSAGVAGLYYYHQLTKDLPRIERLSDYEPRAVSSIYAADGKTLIAEVYEEKRYPVNFDDIPKMVRNAFLAAEDANFYSHPGIDFRSIARALYVNIRQRGKSVQGGSTITQQVVKSLLLNPEKTYERKAKEAILAYRLEQALSKDDIFSIYLNEIYLGSHAYGIKAAAWVHFHKNLHELSLAEAAYLAGLPPRPSYLANPKNRADALSRQSYVLDQMEKNGFITFNEHREAKREELKIYPPSADTIYEAPYFVSHVLRVLEDQLGPKIKNPGGHKIVTTLDVNTYKVAERSVQAGLREVDKRRGWRGPIANVDDPDTSDLRDSSAVSRATLENDKIYRAVVTLVSPRTRKVQILVGDIRGEIAFAKSSWANKFLERDESTKSINPLRMLKRGDVIEVSLDGVVPESDKKLVPFKLDQTPQIEGAFVVANALTGEVPALIGGYSYQRNKFNRATQALRQPGSSFKPFIYLAAIETLGYTPATIVPDSPISLVAGNGEIWSPNNYDKKFLGPITLRTALQRSRNVVSVYMLERIGVENVIEVARRFGISTAIPAELSIALGSAEVKLIEMVRAYGAFAAGGWLAETIVLRSIEDRYGKTILEKLPKQQQVMNPDDAFLMANMMKGVVERGTAQSVKVLKRPVAGKTGTTNDQMDAWFIGYTPEWVGGAWVGFDVKKTIGRFETGGKAAAPIFIHFMKDFLQDEIALDFDIPDGVNPVPINLSTGTLAPADSPNAFIEYFKTGTEPTYRPEDIQAPRDYLSSDEF